LAGKIYRLGKGFEQDLDNVMWLFSVEQFQMQIASRLVGKTLKEFSRQSETKGARHVLIFFTVFDAFELQVVKAAPDQVRPAAEIDDASGQTFIHWDVRFAGERIARIKPGSVTTDAFLVAERFAKRLAEHEAAIFHRVVRVHFEIARAAEAKVQNRVPGEQRQHVIKEWNARLDRRLSLAVDFQFQLDASLASVPQHLRLPFVHVAQLSKAHGENKAPNPGIENPETVDSSTDSRGIGSHSMPGCASSAYQ